MIITFIVIRSTRVAAAAAALECAQCPPVPQPLPFASVNGLPPGFLGGHLLREGRQAHLHPHVVGCGSEKVFPFPPESTVLTDKVIIGRH